MDVKALTDELLELAIAFHSGAATDDQRARLERLLLDEPKARSLYLSISDGSVTLCDLAAGGSTNDDGSGDDDSGKESTRNVSAASQVLNLAGRIHQRIWALYAIAAVLLLSAVAAWIVMDSGSDQNYVAEKLAESSFARVLNVSDVVWKEGSHTYQEWDRLSENDELQILQGRLELLYDNGVQCLIQGPADLQFASQSRVDARSGKLVARVSPDAIGFEISTPHANLIDQGTAFGVTVDEEKQTDVIVYEGEVDLGLANAEPSKRPRLAAGDAIRIDRNGGFGRIVSVAGDMFLSLPASRNPSSSKGGLIAEVRDNLTTSQTNKCYRVIDQGFREECQAFVDRPHQWNGVDASGIPPFLAGCDYVMTFNDDKSSTDIQVSVLLTRPARLYVLIDNRVERFPEWLTKAFTDTGWDVGVDEGYVDYDTPKQIKVGPGKGIDNTCSVWSRDILTSGPVSLGAPRDPEVEPKPWQGKEQKFGLLMYGIVAAELPAEAEGRATPVTESTL